MSTRDLLTRLRAELDRAGPDWVERRSGIAFSGGVDSTLLLAALKRLGPEANLVALHVDHGLHVDSRAWVEHCRAAAAALGVAFETRRIRLDPQSAESLEAAARDARYQALVDMLAPGDVLMTAHHGDDQLETVLQRLLRGSGVRGLTAIHESGALERVRVLRPLLVFSRAEIRAEAEAWGLDWLEDPANEDASFDRSYLRTHVVPALKRRWPGAHKTAVRLTRQMLEAEQILAEMAGRDAASIAQPARVPGAVLRELGGARQANLLRHLVRGLGLPVPSRVQLEQIQAALATSRADAEPLVTWPGGEARIYRDHLYLMPPLPAVRAADTAAHALTADAGWAGAQGRLAFARTDELGLPDAWVREGLKLRFRAGGERFRPLRDAHSRSLKHWLQDHGVVPWMRDRIPLLFHGRALVAVGDLCLGDEVRSAPGPYWRPVWTDHPPVT